MSHAEILAELPKLKPEQRSEIVDKIWEIQNSELTVEAGLSEAERAFWNAELAEFERDGDLGEPWEVALGRITTELQK